jgi:hypothetical protein
MLLASAERRVELIAGMGFLHDWGRGPASEEQLAGQLLVSHADPLVRLGIASCFDTIRRFPQTGGCTFKLSTGS